MTSRDFAYWLQGLFELSNSTTLDAKQVETIKNHLKLVFLHEIDPSYSDNTVVQQIFQNIHDGKDPLTGIDIKSQKPFHQRPNNGTIVKC